ncbi:MAG: hypothetical protein ACXWHB_07120 [Usitatibacter sp.]
MKIRALSFLAAAAFILVACAEFKPAGWGEPPPRTLAKDCTHSAKCPIVVTVVSCTPGGVIVDGEWHIKKRNVVIEWTFDEASSRFQFDRSTGIAFKDDPKWPWRDEFHSPSSNGSKFMWHDKNDKGSVGRVYAYGMTILNADGSLCTSFDPIVINDA